MADNDSFLKLWSKMKGLERIVFMDLFGHGAISKVHFEYMTHTLLRTLWEINK